MRLDLLNPWIFYWDVNIDSYLEKNNFTISTPSSFSLFSSCKCYTWLNWIPKDQFRYDRLFSRTIWRKPDALLRFYEPPHSSASQQIELQSFSLKNKKKWIFFVTHTISFAPRFAVNLMRALTSYTFVHPEANPVGCFVSEILRYFTPPPHIKLVDTRIENVFSFFGPVLRCGELERKRMWYFDFD